MDTLEALKTLDRYDFSTELRTTYYVDDIDCIKRLRREIINGYINDNYVKLALESLKDWELIKYFTDEYQVKFDKITYYAISKKGPIADLFDNSSLRKR